MPLTDQLHATDACGFSPRVVVDLHKFLAMTLVEENTGDLTVDLIEGFKTVVSLSNSCSPRVNLSLRASMA